MNFLYYAYVGTRTLHAVFGINKSIQLGATAPSTSVWDHRRSFTAVSNWFDDIYLNPLHPALHDCPRFAKSGLTSDGSVPLTPQLIFQDYLPGLFELTKPDAPILYADPFGTSDIIDYDYVSFPQDRNDYIHAIPSPIIACFTPAPLVCPPHPGATCMVLSRLLQKLFGTDTSHLPTTHFLLLFGPPGPLSHYVCIRSGSHKHSVFTPHNTPLSPNNPSKLFAPLDKPTMPPRSAKSSRKPPPETVAPYPPFGRHPSDPAVIVRSELHLTNT
jgi:hypothetical protein